MVFAVLGLRPTATRSLSTGEGLFAVFVLVLHFYRAAFDARAADFGAEADVQPLFFEGLAGFARQLAVCHRQ